MLRVENASELVATCHDEIRYRSVNQQRAKRTRVQKQFGSKDYKTPKGRTPTHTSLDGGTYCIPDDELYDLYDHIVRGLQRGEANYLNELLPSKEDNPDRLSKLYLDLDIKFSLEGCSINDLTPQHFLPITQVLQRVVKDAYRNVVDPQMMRCIVLLASHNIEKERKDNIIIYKRGMHITWDHITTDQVSRMSVRREMIDQLNKAFPNGVIPVGNGALRIENTSEYGWAFDVVDEAISFEPSQRLAYCFKVQKDCKCEERYKDDRTWKCPRHYRGRKHIHSYYALLTVMKHDGTQDDQALQQYQFNLPAMMMAVSLRKYDEPVQCNYATDHLIDRYPSTLGSGKKKTNEWDNAMYAGRCRAFVNAVKYQFGDLTFKETSWFYYPGNRNNWRTSYFRVYYYDLECLNKWGDHSSNAGYIHVDIYGFHRRCTSQKCEIRGSTGLMCKDAEWFHKIPYKYYKDMFGPKGKSPYGRGGGAIPPEIAIPPRFSSKIPHRAVINRMPPKLQIWWNHVYHIQNRTRHDPVLTWEKYCPRPVDEDAIYEDQIDEDDLLWN